MSGGKFGGDLFAKTEKGEGVGMRTILAIGDCLSETLISRNFKAAVLSELISKSCCSAQQFCV